VARRLFVSAATNITCVVVGIANENE